MQHFPGEKIVLALVVSSLILFAFMLLATTNTVTNVSAVEAKGVGVYWDSDCTDRVSSIDWGTLTPGSLKNVVVYIQNEDMELIYLITSTTNWNPSKASDYITVRWDYDGQWMNPGENLQITLTLSVTRYIEGISNFSFDITVTGSAHLLGDVNGDLKVNILDVILVATNSGPVPPRPPECDVNGDDKVDVLDIILVVNAYNFG